MIESLPQVDVKVSGLLDSIAKGISEKWNTISLKEYDRDLNQYFTPRDHEDSYNTKELVRGILGLDTYPSVNLRLVDVHTTEYHTRDPHILQDAITFMESRNDQLLKIKLPEVEDFYVDAERNLSRLSKEEYGKWKMRDIGLVLQDEGKLKSFLSKLNVEVGKFSPNKSYRT